MGADTSADERVTDGCVLTPSWRYSCGKCVDSAPAWLLKTTHESGGVVFVASHDGIVAALAANSGSERWRTQLGGRVEADLCICVTGDAEALLVVGAFDGDVYFLRCSDGSLAWRFSTGDEVKCMAMVEDGPHGGVVWLGSHDRRCYALSVAELPGRCVFRVDCEGSVIARPCCSTALCGAGVLHRVFVASQDGKVRAVAKRGPCEYECLWETDVSAPVFAGLVTVGSACIAADVTGTVISLADTGAVRWTTQCGTDGIFAAPVLYGAGSLLVSLRSGELCCLCVASGEQRWSLKVADAALTSAGIDDRVACVGSASGTLTAVQLRSESEPPRLMCHHRLPAAMFGSPLVRGDTVVVGCRDDHLHCFRLGQGVQQSS